MYTAWKNGINNPYLVMQVCDKVGLPFAAACAMLEKESAGGDNIFGHDPTIFVGAGKVTKQKYLDYRAERKRTGKIQGVGPCQLTWWAFQDSADALGGCWKPRYNMEIGFGLLENYWAEGPKQDVWVYVGTRYNGSLDYGIDFAKKVSKWKDLLS